MNRESTDHIILSQEATVQSVATRWLIGNNLSGHHFRPYYSPPLFFIFTTRVCSSITSACFQSFWSPNPCFSIVRTYWDPLPTLDSDVTLYLIGVFINFRCWTMYVVHMYVSNWHDTLLHNSLVHWGIFTSFQKLCKYFAQ